MIVSMFLLKQFYLFFIIFYSKNALVIILCICNCKYVAFSYPQKENYIINWLLTAFNANS